MLNMYLIIDQGKISHVLCGKLTQMDNVDFLVSCGVLEGNNN